MQIDYDIEKICEFLKNMKYVIGVPGYICTNTLSPMSNKEIPSCKYCKMIAESEEGEKRCQASDDCLFQQCHDSKDIRFHRCHAGLFDIAAPIIKDHVVLGYIMLGQISVNEKEDGSPFVFDDVTESLKDLPLDLEAVKAEYEKLPKHDMQYIRSLVSLTGLLSRSLWTEDVIRVGPEDTFQQILTYLSENLNEDLSVERICKLFWISPPTLYARFHKFCSCTYSEYLNTLRIDKAKLLLLDSNIPIARIAATVGIRDRFYFSRIFKEFTGLTPTQYRKQYLNEKVRNTHRPED